MARSFPGAEDGYLSCRGCQRVGPTSSLSGARRTTDVADERPTLTHGNHGGEGCGSRSGSVADGGSSVLW